MDDSKAQQEVTIRINVPEEGGTPLYETDEFSFSPGMNVLVGCNGSGKTSLMRCVADRLRDRKDVAVRMISVAKDGQDVPWRLLSSGRGDDITLASTMLVSSEGNRMSEAFIFALEWLGTHRRRDDLSEIWLMLDSLDSGLDIPTIRLVKDVLGDIVHDMAKGGIRLFILASANGYAVVEGEGRCIDVRTGAILSFGCWDEYAAFCTESDIIKQKRYDAMAVA